MTLLTARRRVTHRVMRCSRKLVMITAATLRLRMITTKIVSEETAEEAQNI
jgi:hypothetical protein